MTPVRGNHRRPVLLLRVSDAVDSISGLHGDSNQRFHSAWGEPLEPADGRCNSNRIDPRDYAGIIISGSPASLVQGQRAPWMDEAAGLLLRARDCGTPVLGVCFGHQLIGHGLGGSVVENPVGWEIGTCEITVTTPDPLFSDLPRTLQVNLSHRDIIDVPLPAGLTVLAESALTRVQAVAAGEHIRGIQFHPEFTGGVTRAYIAARRHLLSDPDGLLARTTDCPDGVSVMHNFRKHFVERA